MALFPVVIPAKAGIHGCRKRGGGMDSRFSRLCENSEPTACIGRMLPKSGDLDSEDSRRPAPRFECSKRRADPGVFTQPGKRESIPPPAFAADMDSRFRGSDDGERAANAIALPTGGGR